MHCKSECSLKPRQQGILLQLPPREGSGLRCVANRNTSGIDLEDEMCCSCRFMQIHADSCSHELTWLNKSAIVWNLTWCMWYIYIYSILYYHMWILNHIDFDLVKNAEGLNLFGLSRDSSFRIGWHDTWPLSVETHEDIRRTWYTPFINIFVLYIVDCMWFWNRTTAQSCCLGRKYNCG